MRKVEKTGSKSRIEKESSNLRGRAREGETDRQTDRYTPSNAQSDSQRQTWIVKHLDRQRRTERNEEVDKQQKDSVCGKD